VQSISSRRNDMQELLSATVAQQCLRWATRVLNKFMEIERELFLGCRPYERSPVRRGLRNGYDPRRFDTRWGPVRLRMPKVRGATQPFRSRILRAYARRQESVERCILQWVASGMSTRAVSRALSQAFGAIVSAATVSRIVAKVDAEMNAFRNRRLERGLRHVYLDGKHGKIGRHTHRRGRGRQKKAVLLLAWGIDHDGKEDLIDFQVAPDESEASWDAFLRRLRKRGVVELNRFDERLERIITDGHGGIAAALALNYPETPHQVCVFHKIKNLAEHLYERAHRKSIQKDAGKAFEARTRAECLARLRRWRRRWEPHEPEAVGQFLKDIDHMLLFYASPFHLRRRLKSTNPIERFIRELDRKFEQAGPYPNARSWERATYLVYSELRDRGYAAFRRRHDFTRNS